MDDSFPRKPEIWPGQALRVVAEMPAPMPGRPFGGPRHPGDFANRLYASETLAPPAPAPDAAEPYSLQWFLDIENQRHGRRGRWIPRLLEFAKHSGETLLGLGTGLGTDWVQYARHGTEVVVCAPAAEPLALVRRNFELRGLRGRFVTARPTCLPLETSSVDVACLSGLLEDVPDPAAVVEEVYRVLKPGGKVIAVAPARHDVDYWADLFLPWRPWLRKRAGGATPVRFGARELHRLFGRFAEHRVYRRQLRRGEVPPLWRCLPLPFLERLLGRVLVLKGFKPLSAAMTGRMAA